MDKKAFSEIEERLLEVNKVIAKLDPSIRVAAFDFLRPYIAGGTITVQKQTTAVVTTLRRAATLKTL